MGWGKVVELECLIWDKNEDYIFYVFIDGIKNVEEYVEFLDLL